MTRYVKIGEATRHLSALLAEVEAGEDLVICRGATPVARVTAYIDGREQAAVRDAAPVTGEAAWRDDRRAPGLAARGAPAMRAFAPA